MASCLLVQESWLWSIIGFEVEGMDPFTLMLLLGAGQAASNLIPTAGDRENQKAIKELEGRKAAGTLGLSSAEEQMIRRNMIEPVQAMATEQQMRNEAAMGAMGNRSGRDVLQAQKATADVIASAAQKAGAEVANADLAAKRALEQELSERKAIKGARQQERLNAISKIAAQTAGATGAYKGYTQEGPTSPLDTTNMKPGTQKDFAELLKSSSSYLTEEEIAALFASALGSSTTEKYTR
jgi:hypothetical protein